MENLVGIEKKDLEIKYYYYCYFDDEEITRISGFCRLVEIDIHHFAGQNVSVDLKYDAMCQLYIESVLDLIG